MIYWRHRSVCWAGIIGVVVGLCLSGADARASTSGFCQPAAIMTKFIDQKFEEAQELNRDCIEHYRDLTAGLSPQMEVGGWHWLNVLNVGYHLATGSQIAAEMGRHTSAAEFIDEAKSHADLWNEFFESPLVRWDHIINVTIGFQLERKGALEDAKRWYESHPGEHTYARLAAIALAEQNTGEAKEWAYKALKIGSPNPQNLTAMIVLAGVAEEDENGIVSSIEREAIAEIKKILKQDWPHNQFMPVYFGEIWWAKEWIERMGTIGMPPKAKLP